MNYTVAPVTRCHVRRIKSTSARIASPLVTHCRVFRQLTMTRNAACRSFGRLLRTYAIALSFNLLSISFGVCFFDNGPSLAGASSVPPARQGSSRTSVIGAVSRHISPFAAAEESKALHPQLDTAAANEAASTAELQQSFSQWTHTTEKSEALLDGKDSLRPPGSVSPAVPWSVVGTVLPAYLLLLEHELRASLNKLTVARWKAVASRSLGAEPRFWSPARNFRGFAPAGGAFETTASPLLRATDALPGHEGSVDLRGGVFDELVEDATQMWRGFHALVQANGYAGTVLPPAEETVQQPPTAPAQEPAFVRVAPSDYLLLRRVRKTVHQILNDITTLASVQQLVSDFARRLNYSLQAEQQLRERIGCLETPDSQLNKSVEGGAGGQPGENRCGAFEEPRSEEDRRKLRLALEKQLTDVQRAAKDAAHLLFSVLSTPEFDSPLARHSISLLHKQGSPLRAVAPPLVEQVQGFKNDEFQAGAQVVSADSEGEMKQGRLSASPSESSKVASPGMAPRSLATAPVLRGQTLFGKEASGRSSYHAASLGSSPKRSSSQAPAYVSQRQIYRCHRRPSEVQEEDLLRCECKQMAEHVPETTLLQPILCARPTRRSSHRPAVTTVEQALECYPSTPEVTYTQRTVEPLPRTSVAYTTTTTRPLLPGAEPSLQCECHAPRTQYECMYVPPRVYPPKEAVSIVPEIVEHRVTEPVLMPVECEYVPTQEVYVPPPAPVPETVLVPCECIERGVRVTESYLPRQTDVYSAPRESVLIPVECVLRSPQPERVPCECVVRHVPDSLTYMRAPAEYAPYLECICSKEHFSPSAYPPGVYPYDVAE